MAEVSNGTGKSGVQGSARVSRVGDGVLAIADFSYALNRDSAGKCPGEVRFGATPKPARETRALFNHRHGL